MSKTISLFAILFSTFIAASASAGSLKVERCNANHNRWYKDSCSRASGGGACSASFDGSYVTVNFAGQQLSGTVGRPFERESGNTRHDIRFGGLVRGMLITRGYNPRVVEVYYNDDYSGNTYTRYTCRM